MLEMREEFRGEQSATNSNRFIHGPDRAAAEGECLAKNFMGKVQRLAGAFARTDCTRRSVKCAWFKAQIGVWKLENMASRATGVPINSPA